MQPLHRRKQVEEDDTLLTIGVGADKFLGVLRIFSRISPKLPKNFLCEHFFPQRSWRPSFGMTSRKKVCMWFCKRWTPLFQIKQRWGLFWPVRFSQILPRF